MAHRTDATENVLKLDADVEQVALRRSVALLHLPDATPGQRATTLALPEVADFFRGVSGRRWRWPVMGEVRRQQASQQATRKRRRA